MLVIVKGETAQVVVGQPVVLKRGNLVLAGGLPMALSYGETIGISLGFDETLKGLGVGILSDGECLAGCFYDGLTFVEVCNGQCNVELCVARVSCSVRSAASTVPSRPAWHIIISLCLHIAYLGTKI